MDEETNGQCRLPRPALGARERLARGPRIRSSAQARGRNQNRRTSAGAATARFHKGTSGGGRRRRGGGARTRKSPPPPPPLPHSHQIPRKRIRSSAAREEKIRRAENRFGQDYL